VTYVRFVVGGEDESAHRLDGIFVATRRLREVGELEPYEVEWLRTLNQWFNENLPCPPFRKNRRDPWWQRGVCWFRSDAKAMLDRMWDIVALLKEKGEPVRFVATANPGWIVYPDDYQIVAASPVRARP